ncbi:MAG TPA: 2-hydroxyglutaryl-CoA dehydratase [Firmicutes bacterium]|nr:2-hydroxyglutaryl-CoA dehydratase [Bacillota bacterium]
MSDILVVGIPQSLKYFDFSRAWESMFSAAGVEWVYSGPTTKTVLDMGVESCVSEACLPIKLIHGQVASLIGRVECVFLPRLVNIRGRTVFCPKFLGLPDMVRASLGNRVRLLSPRIDLRSGTAATCLNVFRFARSLGSGTLKAVSACGKFVSAVSFDAANSTSSCVAALDEAKRTGPVIGVLGYPYLVEDDYVNMGLLNKLRSLGARVVKLGKVGERELTRFDREFEKQVFWYYSDRVVKTGFYLCRNKLVDGLIHLTAFGCGPDAIADKLLELEAKTDKIPYLTISVDECTGEAGIQTRVEAFVDMLTRKPVRPRVGDAKEVRYA